MDWVLVYVVVGLEVVFGCWGFEVVVEWVGCEFEGFAGFFWFFVLCFVV